MMNKLAHKKFLMIGIIIIAFTTIFLIQRFFVELNLNGFASDYWRFANERRSVSYWLWWDTIAFYLCSFLSCLFGSWIIMIPDYKIKMKIGISFSVILAAILPTILVFESQIGYYTALICTFYFNRHLMSILLLFSGCIAIIVTLYYNRRNASKTWDQKDTSKNGIDTSCKMLSK